MPIIRQQQSRAFKDISLSFKRHPVTNDVLALTNEDAIKRSVRNLVQTINEERFFNSLIGSHVKESLFKVADNSLRATLKTQIRTTIENFEPRVNLLDVSVNPNEEDNEMNVVIQYEVTGIDVPPQQLEFVLLPTR